VFDHGYDDCQNPDRSANDFRAVIRLLEKGFSPEEVLWLVTRAPAIGQRRADWRWYWPHTIKNAVKALKGGAANGEAAPLSEM
jgi:hypothetical protein